MIACARSLVSPYMGMSSLGIVTLIAQTCCCSCGGFVQKHPKCEPSTDDPYLALSCASLDSTKKRSARNALRDEVQNEISSTFREVKIEEKHAKEG